MENIGSRVAELESKLKLMKIEIETHKSVICDMQQLSMKMSDQFTESLISVNVALEESYKTIGNLRAESSTKTELNSEHIEKIYHMIAEIFDKLLPVFNRTFPSVQDTEKQIDTILKRPPPK